VDGACRGALARGVRRAKALVITRALQETLRDTKELTEVKH